MLGKARKGLLVPSVEKFCVGVKDPQREPKVLYNCERPVVLSEKLCMGVRDPWCYPKSYVWVKETHGVSRKVLSPKKKTHCHVYHLDLELSDGSRDWLPIGKLH